MEISRSSPVAQKETSYSTQVDTRPISFGTRAAGINLAHASDRVGMH